MTSTLQFAPKPGAIYRWLLDGEMYDIRCDGRILARLSKKAWENGINKWRWETFSLTSVYTYGIVNTLDEARKAAEIILLRHGFRVLTDREVNLL